MNAPRSRDAVEMLRELRAQAGLPERGRWQLVERWKAEHAAGALDGERLADVALLLLQTLRDDDGSLDMVAADLLRRHGGPRHLEPLRVVRPKLRARTGLRDWRLEVGRAIASIEARLAERCECGVHAAHGAPLGAADCEIERVRTDHAGYGVDYEVRCRRCGQRWLVREQHGYHYPTFAWRPAHDHDPT
jgi:hypothetical protein